MGALETGSGREPGTSCRCPPLPWWQVSWGPLEFGRKRPKVHAREKVEILGDVLGEDLNNIFIRFPGVPFNMLIHQNEHTEGSGPFKECRQRGPGTKADLGCVNHVLLGVLR